MVGLTHQGGTIANRYRYDPFGNTMNQGTEENVSNPFKFGGEFYDSEIGLYKQGLRFYDPRLGRWTQRDPLDQVTEPRQSNRYAFASQDPINRVDPSGAIDFGRVLATAADALYITANAYTTADVGLLSLETGPAAPFLFAGYLAADYKATEYFYDSTNIGDNSYIPHDPVFP